MSAPIRIKRVRPGDDTDTYCGKCKAERTHQVVALNANGVPATVICRTCGSQHRFHEKKEPAASRSASGTGRKTQTPAASKSSIPTGPVRPYSPKGVYSDGEWIEHSKFGQGRVLHARGGKIEVRFESGNRVLIHAG